MRPIATFCAAALVRGRACPQRFSSSDHGGQRADDRRFVAVTADRLRSPSVREHPGAACRKALGLRAFFSSAALRQRAKWLCCATAAARAVSFRARQRARSGRASLIGHVRQSALSRHRRQIRRGQVSARRILPALRTFMRSVRLGHWPHLGEGPASRALIVVNRHDLLAEFRRRRRAAGNFPARSQRLARVVGSSEIICRATSEYRCRR